MKKMAFALLCGGQSRRMGQDKGFIRLGEESILRRLARVGHGFGEKLVSSDNPLAAAETGFRQVSDLHKNCGPVGALYSVLSGMESEAVLTLPCDLPLFPAELAHRMVEAMPENAEAMILEDHAGRPHPLCAVLRKRCLPVIRQHVEAGKLKAMPMLQALGAVRFVMPRRFPDQTLLNLNTPEDLAVLREYSLQESR